MCARVRAGSVGLLQVVVAKLFETWSRPTPMFLPTSLGPVVGVVGVVQGEHALREEVAQGRRLGLRSEKADLEEVRRVAHAFSLVLNLLLVLARCGVYTEDEFFFDSCYVFAVFLAEPVVRPWNDINHRFDGNNRGGRNDVFFGCRQDRGETLPQLFRHLPWHQSLPRGAGVGKQARQARRKASQARRSDRETA